MHGGPSPGAPKGNQNALKHGRYSSQTILQKRQIAALIGEMRRTAQWRAPVAVAAVAAPGSEGQRKASQWTP
jgi:hypothetical protein